MKRTAMKRSPKRRLSKAQREARKGKPDTRSRVSKRPLKDALHRKRVNMLPCCVCAFREQPSEAHHIREMYSRTMGRRIGDDKVVPLCVSMINRPGCHENLHKYSRNFWDQINFDPRIIAAELYAETLRLRKIS